MFFNLGPFLRKELVVLFPGVYVDHTGRASWIQRAWGAVLYAWPAALAGESAPYTADELDAIAKDLPKGMTIDAYITQALSLGLDGFFTDDPALGVKAVAG